MRQLQHADAAYIGLCLITGIDLWCAILVSSRVSVSCSNVVGEKAHLHSPPRRRPPPMCSVKCIRRFVPPFLISFSIRRVMTAPQRFLRLSSVYDKTGWTQFVQQVLGLKEPWLPRRPLYRSSAPPAIISLIFAFYTFDSRYSTPW